MSTWRSTARIPVATRVFFHFFVPRSDYLSTLWKGSAQGGNYSSGYFTVASTILKRVIDIQQLKWTGAPSKSTISFAVQNDCEKSLRKVDRSSSHIHRGITTTTTTSVYEQIERLGMGFFNLPSSTFKRTFSCGGSASVNVVLFQVKD
jgi:hypothetical protein